MADDLLTLGKLPYLARVLAVIALLANMLYSKGSMSFKSSNARRESITRRAAMRLGGLRVITSGGVSAGIDAALYLVSILVSEESAREVARRLQWQWTTGIVVDGLDV